MRTAAFVGAREGDLQGSGVGDEVDEQSIALLAYPGDVAGVDGIAVNVDKIIHRNQIVIKKRNLLNIE